METIAKDLNETMEELAKIVSTSKEGDEISEDPALSLLPLKERQKRHTKNIWT